jgi:hypothetical protein
LLSRFNSTGISKKYDVKIENTKRNLTKEDCKPLIDDIQRITSLKIDKLKIRQCIREQFKTNFLDELMLKYFLEDSQPKKLGMRNSLVNLNTINLTQILVEKTLLQAQENCARIEKEISLIIEEVRMSLHSIKSVTHN